MDLGQKIIVGFWFVFFVAALIAVQIANRSATSKKNELIQTGEYAIGTVNGTGGIFATDRRVVYFTFDRLQAANSFPGQEYTSDNVSEELFPQSALLKGHRFLVLYDKDKPSRASILLEMPIRDSLDYQTYIQELESLRNGSK